MNLPTFLLLLVLSGPACADNAPQIRLGSSIAKEDGAPPELGRQPGGQAMQDLLNWGIEHSDPEKLKAMMEKYKDGNLTIKDVYGKDVMDALFVNENSVMGDMIAQIADFANTSIPDEDLHDSISILQDFIGQVDNAGNLHGMGGLKPLLDLGATVPFKRSDSVRTIALWTLGVAVQNNPPVQTDMMDLGGLALLLDRLPLCTGASMEPQVSNEYCGKLIFAISGLVKNNATIQTDADTKGLFTWLLDKGIAHPSRGIAKKSTGLLDIALSQNPNLSFLNSLPARQDAVAKSLLAHLHGGPDFDIDVAEKALRLVNRLLTSRPMLFGSSFRSEFSEAVASATKSCELAHGVGDELCEGLGGLAKHSDLALAVRELSDDEL